MADGGQDFNLGHVVGDTGPKGDTGDTGEAGNGIASIVLRSTSGKVKTYRITFTDGDYFDYQVTDGSDASVTIVTSWNSTTSNSKVPSEKLTKHTHTISNVTNLQTTLDGKASSTHTHTISDVTNLQTTLDGKASSSHSHSISDVTNLQTSLNGKINTSDIANNLTTTSSGKVLDARQGKALADLIGDAITYINQ